MATLVRGASRDRYSLRLLQAMGASGLFEEWRVVEVGAVSWFYEGLGGAYDYWPDGLAGAMQSECPPFDNVALVADNDRMFHRIGWVGDRASAPPLPASAQIEHADNTGWTVTDEGRPLRTYLDSQIRISILWKARVPDASPGLPASTLTLDHIVEVFTRDLAARGADASPPDSPLTNSTWIDELHRIYYPSMVAENSAP
jgi:hypothetical protein